MSVVTSQKPFDEVVRGLRAAAPSRLLVLGCGKCAKVSRTGGDEEVRAMRDALLAEGLDLMTDAATTVEDGACDPEAVAAFVAPLREARFDAVLSLMCGAGLKCVQDALPGKRIIPGINTLGPGVKDQLTCVACGDCGFESGECKMVRAFDDTARRLKRSYGG